MRRKLMLVLSTVFVVFVAIFLAASVAVIVVWFIMQKRSGQETPPDSSELPLLKDEALSTVSVLSFLLSRFDFVQGMKARLAEADLSWSVGRLTSMMLLVAAVTMACLMDVEWLPGLMVLGVGCLAGSLPYAYVLRRRATRLARFEEQFPDALDFLSRALRAGHPFSAALEMLVQESPQPLSAEMRKTFDERQLGLSWEQALQNLARRVPLMDVSFFAAAVQLQSRTGGRLGEVLGRLAETIRERFALRGEVRALAAHGRLTGTVLTIIPLVVAGIMASVNPAYLDILLSNPLGKQLIVAALVALTLAHFVIRRIVKIKI